MRVLLLIFLIVYLALPVNAQMLLTGEVEHTVTSVRNELTTTSPKQIPPHLLLIQIKDENYYENISMLLKGNIELKDRILAKFSDNSYAVMYKNDEYHVWYYSSGGDLTHYEVKSGLNYPYKTYKYNTNQKLINMSMRISKGETFIYTPSGKLIAHWIRNNGYDENGKLIMTRQYFE